MGRRSDDVGGGSQDVSIHGATRDWLRGRCKLRSSVTEGERSSWHERDEVRTCVLLSHCH